MKNIKIRNKLLIILSLIFVASCALFVGNAVANNGKFPYDPYENVTESGGGSTSSIAIILSETEKIIPEFSEFTLSATVSGSREKIKWSSSNENIVVVDSGKVTAVGKGEAEVYATIGSKTVACSVNVIASTLEPTLILPTNAINLVNVENYKYEMKVKVGWDGEEVENAQIEPYIEEGEDVVKVEVEGNKVIFSPLKEGSAIVSITGIVHDRKTHRCVHVNVVDEVVSFLPEDENISTFINGGKFVANVYAEAKDNLVDKNGSLLSFKNTLDLRFKIAKNGVEDAASIKWQYLNSKGEVKDSIAGAKIENDVLTISQAGEYNLIGSYDSASLNLTVNSNLVDISLNSLDKNGNKAVIETSSVTEETSKSYAYKVFPGNFTYNVDGDVEDYDPGTRPTQNTTVFLHGKKVASYNDDGQLMFAEKKDNLPLSAKDLGEQDLIIQTQTRRYHLPVTLYTLVISNKDELDSFKNLAKLAGKNDEVYDGYFVMDADVDYNDDYESLTNTGATYIVSKISWNNTDLYGFKGVFDGMGHSINGINIKTKSTESGGFVGYLHREGVVRNIAFTNASIEENQALIAAAGGGLVENIYVSFRKIGAVLGNNRFFDPNHATETRPMGLYATSFCGNYAKAVNCFIDVSSTEILYAQNDAKLLDNLCLGGKESAMSSVILICPNADYAKTSNANYQFAYYGEMDSVSNGLDLNAWGKSGFWKVEGNLVYCDAMKIDEPIAFNIKTGCDINIGSTLTLKSNLSYVKYEVVEAQGYKDKVHIVGNELSIDSDIPVGTEIKIRVTDYFDPENTAEETFKVYPALEKASIEIFQEFDLGATLEGNSLIHNVENPKIDLTAVADKLGEKAYKVLIGKKFGDAIVTEKILGDVDIVSNKISLEINNIDFSYFGETYLYVYTEKDGASYEISVPLFIVTKVITTAEEFVNLAKVVDLVNKSGYYKLGNNIVIDAAKDLIANSDLSIDNRIMSFSGTIDGNGYTVSGLHLSNWNTMGWIDEFNNATLKNIGLINMYMGCNSGVIGYGYGTFENVLFEYACISADNTITNLTRNETFGRPGLFVKDNEPLNQRPSVLNNVVFDYSRATVNFNAADIPTGSSQYGALIGAFTSKSTFDNVVVLNAPKSRSDKIIRFNDLANGPLNDGAEKNIYVSYLTEDGEKTNGIKLPTTGWDSEYWTVGEGTIAWKIAD